MTDAGDVVLHETLRRAGATPGLALASRGDALTPYLFDALRRRYPVIGQVDPELTPAQRLLIAGRTFRPDRSRWAEQFYKSTAARGLRTRNASRQLRRLPARPSLVFQVHLLFDVVGLPATIYVDCTHRQSADQWAQWNPLEGRALQQWYEQEQRAYDDAAHLFAFSEPTRESLIVDYGVDAGRVSVVGAGANLDRLPGLRAPRTGPPTVLFIGNDFVRKGGPLLLRAFREVRRRVPDARLVLAGAVPAVEPQPGVEVLGRITDRGRVEQLYREATVFALPSWFDPYPLVLLEAMAFGLPVVATRQTGVPEIVEDGRTGLLVEPGDIDALTAALLSALQDPDAARAMGRAGRGRVEQQLTWDAVVHRMAPALDALAGPTG